MKTYQKLLGASCLVLYLVGCGSGGESPIEMSANSESEFQISSKTDSVTIQGVKLNRGNCVINFVPIRETFQQADIMARMGILQMLPQIIPISMQDFKDMASIYKGFNKKRLAACRIKFLN